MISQIVTVAVTSYDKSWGTKNDHEKYGERRLEVFKNPKEAFEQAIQEGRLSRTHGAANYAGDYMYMGPTSDMQHDAFKHIITREYLAVRS